jgi:DNA helicase II / ATP-dependent DNA helicase PcrA
MNYTEEQQRIIAHGEGHARVSAVAGSGKTTTMIGRIGHLLRQGVTADKILVLMFNKSARDSFALSMAARLAELRLPLPEVRTFHALGLRLVASFSKRRALPAYRLETEDHMLERLARQVVVEALKEEEEGWPSPEEVEEFLTFLDQVKGTLRQPSQVLAELGLSSRYRYFPRAYELFEHARRNLGLRFYADLIHEPLLAMQDDPALAAWVGDRVDHIIVDEYQDINEAQQLLLKIVAGQRARVMVVGDVDQCIYEWRGAKPEYITGRFQRDFPAPSDYLLSHTFRYGHALSLVANHLIAHNRRRDDKLCISHPTTPATRITLLPEPEPFAGKSWKTKGGNSLHPLTQVLAEWQAAGRSLTEAVVLVRLFAQAVPVELALLQAGIPYRLLGNTTVFACPEIVALLGYLQLVAGLPIGGEDGSGRRATLVAMLSQPHIGLKREELEGLAAAIGKDPPQGPRIIEQWGGGEFSPFLRRRLSETASAWRRLLQLSPDATASSLLPKIVEILGLYEFYQSFSARAATAGNRIKTCQAFTAFAAVEPMGVADFLARVGQLRQGEGSRSEEGLLITSVHRAKGLEWPLVILPGLEEGSFPFYGEEAGTTGPFEDERRLFYVAMTRAIESLVVLHPRDLRLHSHLAAGGCTYPGPPHRASRFLYESNAQVAVRVGTLLDAAPQQGSTVEGGEDPALAVRYVQAVGGDIGIVGGSEVVEDGPQPGEGRVLRAEEIVAGMGVWHDFFGTGTVLQVLDKRQGRVKVEFPGHGSTILLAAYARLREM